MSVKTFGVTGSGNFAVIGGGYKAQVLGDQPLAYYRLDETSGTTFADSSGNAHTGTLVGSNVLLGQTGAIPTEPSAKSLKITAAGTYVDIPSGEWMNTTATQSVELWLKPGSNTANSGVLSRWNQGTNVMLMWYNASQMLEHRWLIGGSSQIVTMNLPVWGVWTHIVGTYDGTAVRLYNNGTLVASTSATGSIATATCDLLIGAYQGSGGTAFGVDNHFIDEVAIYPQALSADRVAAHYASALAA